MINEELIAYIQAQARKNTPHDIIASRLAQAGWKQEDIDEAFRKIAPPPIVSAPMPSVIVEKKADPYREMPQAEKPVEVLPVAQPIKKEEPKVWVPMSASSVAPKVISPIAPTIKPIAPSPVKQAPVVPVNLPGAIHMPVHEELIPTLAPKMQEIPASPKPIPPSETIALGLPKSAILSSYAQDVSSAVIITEDMDPRKKKRITRIVLIILLLIVGVLVFSYAKGYFTFSSLIKKDPREVLVRAPVQFQELESYKTHTEASISLPAFANITAGLTTGQAITSHDMESLSFITNGSVNHTNGNVSYDYSGILKSSLYQDDIPVDLKYDGNFLYATIPHLEDMLGPNAPQESIVSIAKDELPLLLNELPQGINNKIGGIDLYAMLATNAHLPNSKARDAFNDLVQSSTVTEQESETIHGISTYHYELSADRESTKKFITTFVSPFISSLPIEAQEKLNDILATATLDTFEVWIGKDDNALHQYKISLSLPLSQVLSLDDKGIAGSKVRLDWKTSYFDFGTPVSIVIPKDVIETPQYVKMIHDMKIKDAVTNFRTTASNFKNAIGSYGTRPNPTGSCTNPNPSSLFSPVGHSTRVSNNVGIVAGTITSILSLNNNSASCYSTPKAWSLAVPLPSDPTIVFCADSAGATGTMGTLPTGVICE